MRCSTFGSGAFAVPMLELVLAEPFRLEAVVAVRQARVGLAHGRDERLHDLPLDAVGEMARIGHVLEPAPPVRDLSVLRQGVADQGEGAQVRLEDLGERVGRVLAQRPVWVLELVERRLERQLFSADLEAQAGNGGVEQAVPGGAPGDRLLMEELLDLVLELEGLVLADVLEPRLVARERLRPHGGFEHPVVDPVELEREEEELARRRGQALLGVAVELRALRIGGVAGIDETGIGHDPAEQILDRLIAHHRRAERRGGVVAPRHAVELAAIGLGKGLTFGLGAGEIAGEIRAVDCRVEVGQVPLGQAPKPGRLRDGPHGRFVGAQRWVEASVHGIGGSGASPQISAVMRARSSRAVQARSDCFMRRR
jgi:hypothetical protein